MKICCQTDTHFRVVTSLLFFEDSLKNIDTNFNVDDRFYLLNIVNTK